jgi:hypothetical protein
MVLNLGAVAREVDPSDPKPGKKRLVVIPDGKAVFYSIDPANLSTRLARVLALSDWGTSSYLHQPPSGGLIVGFRQYQSMQDVTPNSAYALAKALEFHAYMHRCIPAICAHNGMAGDIVGSTPNWSANYIGNWVRADFVFQLKALQRDFAMMFSSKLFDIYGLSFAWGSRYADVEHVLDTGSFNYDSHRRRIIDELVLVNADEGHELRIRQFQLTPAGFAVRL